VIALFLLSSAAGTPEDWKPKRLPSIDHKNLAPAIVEVSEILREIMDLADKRSPALVVQGCVAGLAVTSCPEWEPASYIEL
jgi:hypothetical protein